MSQCFTRAWPRSLPVTEKRFRHFFTQSAERNESDEILKKYLTQEEKRGSHAIQAGLLISQPLVNAFMQAYQ